MIIRLLLLILPLLLHKAVNLKPNALCGGLSGASRICQLGCPRPGIYHPCPTAFSQLFALFCFHCVHQQSVEKKEHIKQMLPFSPLDPGNPGNPLPGRPIRQGEKQCLSFLKQWICRCSITQYQLSTNTLYHLWNI